MIFKGCPRCHGDIGRESYFYLGVKHVEYYCLLCARIWDESVLLDTLQALHVRCCSTSRQAAIIKMAERALRGAHATDTHEG